MKNLFLEADFTQFSSLFILFIAFMAAVLITRWVFGIDKIIASLEKQNNYSMVQVRLLKKMLINQGTPATEVDEIITEGNKAKK